MSKEIYLYNPDDNTTTRTDKFDDLDQVIKVFDKEPDPEPKILIYNPDIYALLLGDRLFDDLPTTIGILSLTITLPNSITEAFTNEAEETFYLLTTFSNPNGGNVVNYVTKSNFLKILSNHWVAWILFLFCHLLYYNLKRKGLIYYGLQRSNDKRNNC